VTLAGTAYPSLSASLARVDGPTDTTFAIDFAIDADMVDRISVVDLLAGRVPPERVENRQAVIGASALELRDTLVVPRHGALPGALVQILAAETLRLGRAPAQPGIWPIVVIVALLGLAGALLRSRLAEPRMLAAGIGLALGIEGAAFLMQQGSGLLLDTAAIQLSLSFILVAAVLREASEKRRLHLAAARERDRMRSTLGQVIADNLDGVIVIDEAGTIVAASRPARDLLGEALVGAHAATALPPKLALCATGAATAMQDAELTECMITAIDGRHRLIEGGATVSLVADEKGNPGARRAVCITFRDITEKRASEERIAWLDSHDGPTGALTRQEFLSRLDLPPFTQGEATILFIGLGRFNHINAVLGHDVGDLVLRETVRRIESAGVELVARLGGWNFAAALPRTLDETEIARFCVGLADAVGEPYDVGGHRALVTCRLGATTPALSQTADPGVMLAHADMAQTAARALTVGVFATYSEDMETRIRANRDIEIALREAIATRALKLVYQPQYDLDSGRLLGAEALLRWHHPTLGKVPPLRFIGIAEETGIAVELGAQVLEMACAEAATWPVDLRVAVNVSALQFEFDDLPARMRQVLDATGLAPERLDLEITEGTFLSGSSSVLEDLAALRDMGIGIALDDFGTGYSSLSYLSTLPADKLKIDQTFIRQLPDDTRVAAIVETLLDLCRRLGKSVVAEGIETEAQRRWLASQGGVIGQGYLLGRPMPAADLLARHGAQPVAVDAA
jgi:diguanylate cyclase (GGDEF)-like protein